MPQKIDAIHDYEWGTNNSPEDHAKGYTHCFLVTFKSEADRDAYLPHPAHQAFVKVLLQILDELRQRAPISFSLIAVNVDSGYKEYKHDLIASTCRERGWEYRIEHTAIGEVMDDLLEANATPCSLCARLRRGVLYRIAPRNRRSTSETTTSGAPSPTSSPRSLARAPPCWSCST